MDLIYFLATDRDPFHATTLDLVLNTLSLVNYCNSTVRTPVLISLFTYTKGTALPGSLALHPQTSCKLFILIQY